ncbi:hydantoinase/oxoprolinase family protein [Kamptonema cortianum]|nr:hydantoinase/oxoprolinase family protein [Kamptonema cortianum]
MRIGVDVGGTNTDAVLIAGRQIRAAVKCATSADVSSGIVAAVQELLRCADVGSEHVDAVMIGTTQFTNAFVQRRGLDKVFVIRIGYPASRGVPPFSGWPDDIRDTVCGGSQLVRGGYEFDGRQIAPFDEDAVARAADLAQASGVTQIAVSCIFSQLNCEQEVRAAQIVAERVPQAGVSLSSELGRVGLLERENAAIMNASLRPLADMVASAFGEALAQLGLTCPWYVSQNDGTLMSAEQLRHYPVLTFAAGPTNSLRGAAWLTGSADAIVIDVGGTTTDLGVLTKGFPRQSSVSVDIGGVRTNFRVPDILSVGLGGGSRIRITDGAITVGPDSVGHELQAKALVFGGEELTTSDVAVAAGWAEFGERRFLENVGSSVLEGVATHIDKLVEDAVDRMKTSNDPMPAILVGGGSFLIRNVPNGIADLVRPEHAAVANAIGAAIGQVSGEIDRIYRIGSPEDQAAAFDDVQDLARQKVISAGGRPEEIEIVNLEAIPLQYLPGGATRVVCRAVADLADAGPRR